MLFIVNFAPCKRILAAVVSLSVVINPLAAQNITGGTTPTGLPASPIGLTLSTNLPNLSLDSAANLLTNNFKGDVHSLLQTLQELSIGYQGTGSSSQKETLRRLAQTILEEPIEFPESLRQLNLPPATALRLARMSEFLSQKIHEDPEVVAAIQKIRTEISKPASPAIVESSPSLTYLTNLAENGNPLDPGAAGPTRSDKELLELRERVEKDAERIVENEMGGDLNRPDISDHVTAILRRLQESNGIDRDSVSLHYAGSFIPNAFTNITQAEIDYLKNKGRLKATFKNANVFVSHGMVEAFLGQSDSTLAFILAHELAHNRLGHLKTIFNSFSMLGHLLEFDADVEALRMIARAGYDPREALNSLELIQNQIERLEKIYPLLRRDNSEYHQLLSRLRDIHPDNSQRRAMLERRLPEALELYNSSPHRETPKNQLEEIRAALDREPLSTSFQLFEKEAALIVKDSQKSFYEKIVALENLIVQKVRERKEGIAKEGITTWIYLVRMEDQLAVENVFRAMSAAATNIHELDNLFQMYRRLKSIYHAVNFPSARARSHIITRQVREAGRILGEQALVSQLEEFVGKISSTAFQALFIRYLKRVQTPEEWAKALEYIGSHAHTLGLMPGGVEPRFADPLARTLLHKTMSLAVEKNIPSGEKIARSIEYLLSKVPASILTATPVSPDTEPAAEYYLSTHLKAEILDLYFTGKLGKNPVWNPTALALLLEGRTRAQILEMAKTCDSGPCNPLDHEFYFQMRSFGVMRTWNSRYYSKQDISLSASGKVEIQFDKLSHPNIEISNPAELMTLLFVFPYRTTKSNKESSFNYQPANIPETISYSILKHDLAWQERFWEEATTFMVQTYIRKKRFADSTNILERELTNFAEVQKSVIQHSESLGPTTAALTGTCRALYRILQTSRTEDSQSASSIVADNVINLLINTRVAEQIDIVRNSREGIKPQELDTLTRKVLELDQNYSSFNTTERLRTLGNAFYYATTANKDLTGLISFVRPIYEMNRVRGGGSWVYANFFADENRQLFKEAGLSSQFRKLPDHDHAMEKMLTSGALGLIADPNSKIRELIGASLSLYYKHQFIDTYGLHKDEPLLVDQSLAFLLLEEAGKRIKSKADAQEITEFLLKIHDLDPLYLSYLPRDTAMINSTSGYHHPGGTEEIRSEILGVLAAKKQPFRERDAAILRRLRQAIMDNEGWPRDVTDQLKLLDWMGRTADYDASTDREIRAVAEKNPRSFHRWIKLDRNWIRRIRKKEEKENDAFRRADVKGLVVGILEKKLGLKKDSIQLPKIQPAPLRIVRNPFDRAELYRSVKRAPFAEKAAHHYIRERKVIYHLAKAYFEARRFFPKTFLNEVIREANADARIMMVLQETSRIAEEKTGQAEQSWISGKQAEFDRAPWWKRMFTKSQRRNQENPKEWSAYSDKEKQILRDSYRNRVFKQALESIWKLGEQYSSFIDPELGYILDNFPEPNRVRDDLLERLANSRSLTPERQSIIESYKSYRFPNPLRFVEKQFMEAASIQLNKLSPADRVDLILDLGGIQKLPSERLKRLESKMLSRNRKAFIQQNFKIYSFRQFRMYLDQLHPKDKELFVEAMFYGKNSISIEPRQVERLFRSIAIEGRNLPKLVEKILEYYFELLTPAEKVRAITALIRESRDGAALTGPQIVRFALANFGITGYKIGQVLATHKGLLPNEYAEAVKSFTDQAESLEKARILNILEQKLSLLRNDQGQNKTANEEKRRRELSGAAEFLYPGSEAAKREKYVNEILAMERITTDAGVVSDIKELGKELGSGSIKLVYKVTLKDGSIWVAKIRRPGATVHVEREFEILNGITSKLLADPLLKLPNLAQLMDEVRTLVLAELNFLEEAEKNKRTADNMAHRSTLENLVKKGGKVIIPNTHPVYIDEDMSLEEFIPSESFRNLPDRSLFRATKRDLAKAIIDEAAQELILDGYIDPDRHSGNVLKRVGWWWSRLLSGTKPVWIDLGQSVDIPMDHLKPLLKTGLALKYGRLDDSARSLSQIFNLDSNQSLANLQDILRNEFEQKESRLDVMDRLLSAILKAEGNGYIVRKDYAALEKTMLLLNGYSGYLPHNYLMKSLERAVFLRIIRETPKETSRLAWYRLSEIAFGADRYNQFLAEIENLGK